MVTFGNLKQDAGIKSLNEYLGDKSYIEGFTASQSDVAVFEALAGAPANTFVNALRWYTQIASYGSEKKALPGVAPAMEVPMDVQEEDDDDVDLFGSDEEEEDADAARVREERLAAYADKKCKKPGPIAKSQILLDIKPWDDETDMKELEVKVRSIAMDGLVWGASEFKPLAYGIKKLTILSTVVDSKVGVDDLTEKIEEFEEFVQSIDIAAFNKV